MVNKPPLSFYKKKEKGNQHVHTTATKTNLLTPHYTYPSSILPLPLSFIYFSNISHVSSLLRC